jgi:hypothetical protein
LLLLLTFIAVFTMAVRVPTTPNSTNLGLTMDGWRKYCSMACTRWAVGLGSHWASLYSSHWLLY